MQTENNVYKINDLFELNETIAKELLMKFTYPWEVLPHIEEFILEIGKNLNANEYDQIKENIWIHKTAKVADSASIKAPCIICENAEIRHCAFIRGKAIIGKNTVVGNSTELKNAILFNEAKIPHYNYVGDSIIGYKSHLGAGAITSNIKSDKSNVKIKAQNEASIETNMKKVGAFVGDNSEIGCQSVLNPGTIIGKNTNIYPLSSVRGIIPSNSIYKSKDNIVEKNNR